MRSSQKPDHDHAATRSIEQRDPDANVHETKPTRQDTDALKLMVQAYETTPTLRTQTRPREPHNTDNLEHPSSSMSPDRS
jgi:hypothetical protein